MVVDCADCDLRSGTDIAPESDVAFVTVAPPPFFCTWTSCQQLILGGESRADTFLSQPS